MKKILFSDMDGTIIDLNEMKHSHDKEMLEELKNQGHLIAFNTGRNYQEATYCIDRHLFPYDYLVLNNGAHIVDSKGQEIFKKVISQDVGRAIIEHCIKIPDMMVFYYDGKKTIGYCNGQTYEHAKVGNIVVDDIDFMTEYLKADEFDIIAINMIDESQGAIVEVQKYIEKNFAGAAHGCLNTHYLDITASDCTKGSGLLKLKNILGGDVQTYCVGDSYNDISMFEVSDYAYTFHGVKEDIYQHAHKQVNYVYEVIEDMLGGVK